MRARAALSIAVAVILSAAAASPARADSHDDGEADAAIKRGVELRRHAKDQEALEEFRKAYALVKSPRALAQIGLAEQALGRWADAENDLGEAMGSKSDPWIRKNLTTLNGAVDVIRKHLGSLDVIGPAGAELLIDGRVGGTLPLPKPAHVPIGSLTIEVRKEGFFPVTRPVSIAAGELTRESVDLQPMPEAPIARKLDTPSEGGRGPGGLQGIPGGGVGVLPPHPPDDQPNHSGGGWQRTAAWSTAGGALLGAGVGIALTLLHNSKVTDANNVPCNISNGTVSPPDMTQRNHCLDLANGADQARIGSIVAFSAAGALAITSALLFVTSSPSSSSSSSSSSRFSSTALLCAPSLLTPGATCQVRF